MNQTIKISKYLLQDFKKGLIIYYGIILTIALFMIYLYTNVVSKAGGGMMDFSGFGFSAAIFLFVSGLNSFKINFKFMQANNISRKRFYMAMVTTLVIVAGLMAVIDVTINHILKLIMPYHGLFEDLYKVEHFIGDFIWSFALFALVGNAGWFVTMLYYKCGNLMKTVISLAPVLFAFILILIDRLIDGAVVKTIFEFVLWSLGFTTNNPYLAALNFLVAAAGAIALSYLMIRRMSIRD